MIKLENYYKVLVTQLANKNQFAVWFRNNDDVECVAFQSYRTLIAIYVRGDYFERRPDQLFINWQMWDYSKTTLKHLKIFINELTPYHYETKAQFLKEIKNNEDIILFEE